jgi:hypothetical protein
MKDIKKAARTAAGKKSAWITKYERQAFIKGYIQGAMQWRKAKIITVNSK